MGCHRHHWLARPAAAERARAAVASTDCSQSACSRSWGQSPGDPAPRDWAARVPAAPASEPQLAGRRGAALGGPGRAESAGHAGAGLQQVVSGVLTWQLVLLYTTTSATPCSVQQPDLRLSGASSPINSPCRLLTYCGPVQVVESARRNWQADRASTAVCGRKQSDSFAQHNRQPSQAEASGCQQQQADSFA